MPKPLTLESPFSPANTIIGCFPHGILPPGEWVLNVLEMFGAKNVKIFYDDEWTYWWVPFPSGDENYPAFCQELMRETGQIEIDCEKSPYDRSAQESYDDSRKDV